MALIVVFVPMSGGTSPMKTVILAHVRLTKLAFKKEKVFQALAPKDRFHRELHLTDFLLYITLVYDRNHVFGLGSDTETETENWPKL